MHLIPSEFAMSASSSSLRHQDSRGQTVVYFPKAALIQIAETPARKVFRINLQKVQIGRAEDAQIFLDDDSVSRQHAALFFDEEKNLRVRDLGSQNGTYLNGKPVSDEILRHHDILRIGENRFLLDFSDLEKSSD